MNAKVNNWAVELESQNINFEFIAGTKNVLADTLSRLIEFDKSIRLPEEEPGYEFGYAPFEELPPASVTVIEEVIISENQGRSIARIAQNPTQRPYCKRHQNQTTTNQLQDEGTPGTRPINGTTQKAVVRKETGQETLHNGG